MLKKRFGNLYTEQNVLISGSHTHSTPGGHLFHMLYDITILGFSRETFTAMVTGILKVIIKRTFVTVITYNFNFRASLKHMKIYNLLSSL